jgi:5-formyltetrahydrofolate cyclo-ligase
MAGSGMDNVRQRKKELRGRLTAALAGLSSARRAAGSAAACARALAAELFPAGSTVMLYAPMVEQGELDVGVLAAGLVERGCRLCVPRVDWGTRTMSPVVVANLTTDFEPDPGYPGKGLRRPRTDAPTVGAEELDVVVVPGLGFDRAGNRLGRGAGFYDKFLGGLPGSGGGGGGGGGGRPARVVLAFDEQIVERIPVEGHDAGVRVIVTPTEVIRVGR